MKRYAATAMPTIPTVKPVMMMNRFIFFAFHAIGRLCNTSIIIKNTINVYELNTMIN